MERETGIEPATNGLGSRDSTTELLPRAREIPLCGPTRPGSSQPKLGSWRRSRKCKSIVRSGPLDSGSRPCPIRGEALEFSNQLDSTRAGRSDQFLEAGVQTRQRRVNDAHSGSPSSSSGWRRCSPSARSRAARSRSRAARPLSGADVGFRVEGHLRGTPAGTIVIRYTGEWVELEIPPKMRLLR